MDFKASDYMFEPGASGGFSVVKEINTSSAISVWSAVGDVDCTSGNLTITLPVITADDLNKMIYVKKVDSSSNYVKIVPNGTNTINGTTDPIYLYNQNDGIVIMSTSTSNSITMSDAKKTVSCPSITNVYTNTETPSTADGYYIFASSYTGTLPTSVTKNDIWKLTTNVWSKSLSYSDADPTIYVGNTWTNRGVYTKQRDTWIKLNVSIDKQLAYMSDKEVTSFGSSIKYPSESNYVYDKNIFTVGTEADLITALTNCSNGDTIMLNADITLTNTLNITKSIKLDANGSRAIIATTPVVAVSVTGNYVYFTSNVTIVHNKTTNTSVETAVSVNALGFVSYANVVFMESGYLLTGSWTIGGTTTYNGALANTHRHFIVYSVLDNSKIDGVTYDFPSEATPKDSFIYTSITGKFNAVLKVANNYPADKTKVMRQFYLQDSMIYNTKPSMIFENNYFNDLNGGIGIVGASDASPLDDFNYIALISNYQGNAAIATDVYKGLLFIDGSGTALHNIGTTNVFSVGNIHPTKLRSTYTSCLNNADITYNNAVYNPATITAQLGTSDKNSVYNYIRSLDYDMKNNYVGLTEYNNKVLLTAWATNTDYVLGQRVTYKKVIYECTTAHKSDSTNFDKTKWKILGGGAGISALITGDTTVDTNTTYLCDITASSIKLTLPTTTTLSTGDYVEIIAVKGDSSLNNVTLDFMTATQKLETEDKNFIMNTNSTFRFIWIDSTFGWKTVPISVTIGGTTPGSMIALKSANFDVVNGTTYLVDSSASAVTATVPVGVTYPCTFNIIDLKNTSGTNNITVDFATNNYKLEGASTNYIISSPNSTYSFIANESTYGFKKIKNSINEPVIYDSTKAYTKGQRALFWDCTIEANADIAANTSFEWGTSGATWKPILGSGLTWKGSFDGTSTYTYNDVVGYINNEKLFMCSSPITTPNATYNPINGDDRNYWKPISNIGYVGSGGIGRATSGGLVPAVPKGTVSKFLSTTGIFESPNIQVGYFLTSTAESKSVFPNGSYHMCLAVPSDGLPAGIAVGDLFYKDSGNYYLVWSYAECPATLSNGTDTYVKKSGSWIKSVPVVTNTRTTLGSNVSVSSGVLTTILTKTVTIPNDRNYVALIHWNMMLAASSGDSAPYAYISDGTNKFAETQLLLKANGIGGMNSSGISLVSYTPGSSVTFTLKTQYNGSSYTVNASDFSTSTGKTYLQVTLIPV